MTGGKTKMEGKKMYRINYGTGAGDIEGIATLAEAKHKADGGGSLHPVRHQNYR